MKASIAQPLGELLRLQLEVDWRFRRDPLPSFEIERFQNVAIASAPIRREAVLAMLVLCIQRFFRRSWRSFSERRPGSSTM